MAEGSLEPVAPATSTLEVFVRQIRYEGRNIQSYELVAAGGGELPPFAAGAHIDVHAGDGIVRQYSLCNAPHERGRYVIAVLRDERGRGGSKAMHERVRVQDVLRIGRPRNHFELDGRAQRVVLLAGGIGVTPLKAMAHELQRRGADFALHYCARDPEAVAFEPALREAFPADRLHLHFDGGDPSRGLDVARLLREEKREGTHVYYCGPAGFMKACAEAAADWPKGSVHCEHFAAPARPAAGGDEAADETDGADFTVEIASTGQRLAVPPGRSIAEVLRDARIGVETSCEAGLCGTCKVRYLQGEVDHRDCILSEDEQRDFMTVCVSRAKGGSLVLDL
ncbi:oxidoreductase [Burkholderia sp. WAC0059]|uniref:PDR/VanB family oxidoreductase n=1 Tax=Burkholderia sp. WAC0059 TaxID=2066022 RepID=UPI000C7EDAB1|nr:PDR/VanB family oxidoreductase [Burkholderia sp. WAC0059]PLZ01506.1 oxidoreductase [Burkholderia sp. WAC0059]